MISVTDTENVQNSDIIKLQNDKNSGILSIQIYADSEEQCEQVAEIVKKRVMEYTEQLQQIFGIYTVNAISDSIIYPVTAISICRSQMWSMQ